ncbi:5464_t:CDS:10 [Entrophospora sp. SA101]|nr:14194_t:CDS:10 [Entrophospora sp. SA101]CAJ0766401.1 5464_t:CDS:10 [Entrophospora sp. SA101]CAJ0838213.1 233_t:CDS:10 [Entrophospora sp. SA101]
MLNEFNELNLDILVPNGVFQCKEDEIDKLFNAEQRTQAYYDEFLHLYLLLTLPPNSNVNSKSSALELFQQFDISVEASIVDESLMVMPKNTLPPVYLPTPPLMDTKTIKAPEGTLIFYYNYNPKNKDKQMVVVQRNECWSCVVPLSVPVVYVKTHVQSPALSLGVFVRQKPKPVDSLNNKSDSDYYISSENYGLMNLLGGLKDGHFNVSPKNLILNHNDIKRSSSSSSTFSNQSTKRSVRKILSVKAALNVKMRTTSISPLDNMLMMSVELENNSETKNSFSIESINVHIVNGFIKRYEWNPDDDIDQTTFLYSITILENPIFPKFNPQYFPSPQPNSNNQLVRKFSITPPTNPYLNNNPNSSYPVTEEKQRHLSITVKGSSRSNTIFLPTGVSTPTASKSSYNITNNKKNGIISKLKNIPENPGIRHNNHNNIDSRSINNNSHNNNHKEANDGVVVSFLALNSKISSLPLNNTNVNDIQSTNPIEPYMDETEHETSDADVICLENNVRIGPLNPSTCESVTLHFIAVKESLHSIELIQLVDDDTGFITNLRNVLDVYVSRGYYDNKNYVSKVATHIEVTG